MTQRRAELLARDEYSANAGNTRRALNSTAHLATNTVAEARAVADERRVN